MDLLSELMSHLGGMDPDDTQFHHDIQKGMWLKTYKFPSLWNFQFITFGSGWPRITETFKIETADKGERVTVLVWMGSQPERFKSAFCSGSLLIPEVLDP